MARNTSLITSGQLQFSESIDPIQFELLEYSDSNSRFLLTRSQATFGLEQIDLMKTALYEDCPFKTTDNLKPSCPAYSLVFRTMDGTCNNLDHPEWGSAFRAFARFLPPDYR